ncbi:MAG: hypothetical protein A3F11_10555 [Gammaproteobacteria bacterium RIFCSPHIGHO2_12_FULL_37_14]|nr:MAG: hypothetical protein A3F11_10555 [Gammaproteobacteria bacterium RIFCSPHIGHO2_12_FULL_37_14]
MLNDEIDPTQVTEKIIVLLRKHHRMPTSSLKCRHLEDKHCFGHQYNNINELVLKGQPITFILPAFPAKSPNFEKTAGNLPDLGERLSLCLLNKICKEISKFYSPYFNSQTK